MVSVPEKISARIKNLNMHLRMENVLLEYTIWTQGENTNFYLLTIFAKKKIKPLSHMFWKFRITSLDVIEKIFEDYKLKLQNYILQIQVSRCSNICTKLKNLFISF